MRIEFHDAEVGNTLFGRWDNIDYDYQAEEIVQYAALLNPEVVKCILIDDHGERAVWQKEDDSVTLTWTAPRFTGTWALNLPFTREHYRKKYG